MHRLQVTRPTAVQVSTLLRTRITATTTNTASSFSTTSFIMAPPKAALDFVDFVNDSPTRTATQSPSCLGQLLTVTSI